ncbi:integrase, catalytic region, zinc finger, CCHC-type containing protein, partial [Tanacetum coccineum]
VTFVEPCKTSTHITPPQVENQKINSTNAPGIPSTRVKGASAASRASKNKSWLWHRRLNHLNFGTLNDLARKDLVRGLPQLKFKKDHLCSACQLGKTIATACYTQNRSVIHTLHDKTPYELMHDKKPDLSFLHVFGALCYPTNDSEDLGKLKAKADISSGPAPILLMLGPISSGIVPNRPPTAPYVPPTNKELEILFQPMFDEYFETSMVDRLVPPAPAAQALVNPTGPSVSIPIDQEAPSGSHSPSSSNHQSFLVHQGVVAEHSFEVNPFAVTDPEPFVNVFASD